MKGSNFRGLGALGAVVALGVTGLVSTGAQADGGDAARADSAKISMEVEGKNLLFKGARSIDAGGELTIVNNTDAKQIGPHSFSLVEKKTYPELTKEGVKACFKEGVCARIFKAHKVDFEKETVDRIVARSGDAGWDSSFGGRGDSWFSLEQDEKFSQEVSAKPGSKLFYLCVIHPEMQGKIKVQ